MIATAAILPTVLMIPTPTNVPRYLFVALTSALAGLLAFAFLQPSY